MSFSRRDAKHAEVTCIYLKDSTFLFVFLCGLFASARVISIAFSIVSISAVSDKNYNQRMDQYETDCQIESRLLHLVVGQRLHMHVTLREWNFYSFFTESLVYSKVYVADSAQAAVDII